MAHEKSTRFASLGTYTKLASGMLLMSLLTVFVIQNAAAIYVELVVWEADLSLALVVMLAVASGIVAGAAFRSWPRWRFVPAEAQRTTDAARAVKSGGVS